MHVDNIILSKRTVRNILGPQTLEFENLIVQHDYNFLKTVLYLLLERNKKKALGLLKKQGFIQSKYQRVLSDFKLWQEVLFFNCFFEYKSHPDERAIKQNESNFIRYFSDYILTVSTTPWSIFSQCFNKLDSSTIVKWKEDRLIRTRPSYAFRPYTDQPLVNLLFPSALYSFGLTEEELAEFYSLQ